jgi:hypothetical protein
VDYLLWSLTSKKGGDGSQRRVKCPTCRLRVHMNDIALARPGGGAAQANQRGADGAVTTAGALPGEETLTVSGEFGTKTTAVVRRLKWILLDPVRHLTQPFSITA